MNSYHNILDINYEVYYVRMITNSIKFNFSKGNYVDLVHSLNLGWYRCFGFDDINNIDSMWNKFKHIVTQSTEKFIFKTNCFDIWKK